MFFGYGARGLVLRAQLVWGMWNGNAHENPFVGSPETPRQTEKCKYTKSETRIACEKTLAPISCDKMTRTAPTHTSESTCAVHPQSLLRAPTMSVWRERTPSLSLMPRMQTSGIGSCKSYMPRLQANMPRTHRVTEREREREKEKQQAQRH